ncbi:MAG: tRNA pseudouridine(13) synthase TruD [archaeon]
MERIDKIQAKLKHKVEDFIVEEIGEKWDAKVSNEFIPNTIPNLGNLDMENPREFLWCEMEKRDMDHFSAIKEVARLLGKGVDAIGYAGTKDKRAWTSQRISIFTPDIEKVKSFCHPKIILKNFKWNKRKIKMGYLEANRFGIILRDIEKRDAMKITKHIRNIGWFPNYFGPQRFGVKGNNVKIGKLILKRKFEEAIWEISEDNQRQGEYMKYHLERNPDDFLGAIKKAERKNMLMFVHSVQSKIFNEILEQALEENLDFTKKGQTSCLLVGYKTRFYDGRLGEIEQQVLANHNLKLEDFDIKEIPYLRIKGSFRKAVTEISGLEVETSDDEEFEGSKKITLKFTLPSGVYATTFLELFFCFA